MKKNVQNVNDYNKVAPSGKCRMGNTEVTYYRMNGNRLWFDKLQIERVLTGKNQHNLLGQYKDHRNHGTIFDTEKLILVDVISKTGIQNYLKKAWSVKDENRHDYYSGIKNIENPHEKTVTEPLQMQMFDIKEPEKSCIKITETDGSYSVDYNVDGKNSDEKMQKIARMLISVANGLMTGNTNMTIKEVAL